MLGFSWQAGKKAATSLDHSSYYMVIGMEKNLVDGIVSRRSNVPPMAEGLMRAVRRR